MAGDNTQLPIAGYGTIQLSLDTKTVRLAALYVPDVQMRLSFISQYIQYADCAFLAQCNKTYLAFPSFIINVQNTEKFKIQVSPGTTINVQFDEEHAKLVEETTD